MKIRVFFFYAFAMLALFAHVQGQVIEHTNNARDREFEMRRRAAEQREQENARNRLRNLSTIPTPVRELPRGLPKPSEKDRRAISIDKDLLITYKEFLSQSNTGIFRIHDGFGCNDDGKILDINSDCPNAYPGKATAYSFRIKNYQSKFFSDIALQQEQLSAKGFHSLGIISDFGNQPLDELTLTNDGIKELDALEPPKNMEDFQKYLKLIGKGVSIGNYAFSNTVLLKSEHSYLLRVIALKGSLKSSKTDFPFWGEDKRDDITVVFRAIREKNDKSWIIVWKQLKRKDAPKIDF